MTEVGTYVTVMVFPRHYMPEIIFVGRAGNEKKGWD